MKNRLAVVVLILVLTLGTVACSTQIKRPRYDPSIEPFGYESSIGQLSAVRQGFISIDELVHDGITSTILVVTPVSDLKDRKQVGSTEIPRWQNIVAPCEVLAVIKNEPGPNEGATILVGDTINIMEEMHFYKGEDGKVTLYRDSTRFFPMQRGQPYLWFGASANNEIEGVGPVYCPAYSAFDISQREVTDYEVMAMTAPDNVFSQGEYAEKLKEFTQFKKEASQSEFLSPFFDEYAKVD